MILKRNASPIMQCTTFFVLVIAGQLIISALIEQFGWFGMNRNSIPIEKIVGIGLVILGVLCVQFSRK